MDRQFPIRPKNMRAYLKAELVKRRRGNPRYSLRAFAHYLKVNPAYLSQLINGKRLMSESLLLKVGGRLKLDLPYLEKFKQALKRKRTLDRK